MKMLSVITFLLLISSTYSISNMNCNDTYGISNPNQTSKIQFSTNYKNINPNYEYFDVYSPPISTR